MSRHAAPDKKTTSTTRAEFDAGAEQALLATVMAHPAYAGVPLQTLSHLWQDSFVSAREVAVIACAVATLQGAGQLPTHLAVADYLERTNDPASAAAVASVMRDACDPDLLDDLARRVLESTQRRVAARVAEDLASASTDSRDIGTVLHRAENRIQLATGTAVPVADMRTVCAQAWDRYERQRARAGALTGVGTGFSELDRETGGLPFREYSVIGGRTSNGKSTLAMAIALHAAWAGHKVLCIIHEMDAQQWVLRAACSLARLHFQHVSRARLNRATEQRLRRTLDELASSPITIIDESSASPAHLTACASAWKQTQLAGLHEGGLVIVDYLQQEHLPGWAGTRAEELAMISGLWRCTFRRLGLCGLLVCQLARKAVGREPELSDIRESGAIEQDANIVMLLHRAVIEQGDQAKQPANQALLRVAKNRNGSLLRFPVFFGGPTFEVRDWDKGRDEPVFGLAELRRRDLLDSLDQLDDDARTSAVQEAENIGTGTDEETPI